MDIREIANRINENSKLLADGSISELDRDILLDDLRKLYLMVKNTAPAPVSFEQTRVARVEVPPVGVIPVKEEPVIVPIVPVAEQKPVEQEVVLPKQEPPIASPIIEQKPVEVAAVIIPKEEPKQVVIPIESEPLKAVEELMQVVKKEEIKVKQTSLNDIFAGEERSLNDLLSGEKRPALNDQAGRKDLKSMIDFNKQYVLTNELFKGDSQAYQAAIAHINEAPSIEAAFEYIKTTLLPKYQWSGEMQSTRLFYKLVRQKFGM